MSDRYRIQLVIEQGDVDALVYSSDFIPVADFDTAKTRRIIIDKLATFLASQGWEQ